MTEREKTFENLKTMSTKDNDLATYIRELILAGFFDAPVSSADIVKEVKHRFGRKFPPSYIQTYMKPFLQNGILRTQDSPKGHGNVWLGTWLANQGVQPKKDRLTQLNVDTSGWESGVAEDFGLSQRCYSEELWKPAAVMVRRAYEGALITKFKALEGADPQKQATCPKCNTKLGTRPLSITDLHYWAVSKGLVREKLEGLSVLLKDLGAGGAHPTKAPVIDPDTAEIILKCGAVLLRDLNVHGAGVAVIDKGN
jgi:hypothetical protein